MDFQMVKYLKKMTNLEIDWKILKVKSKKKQRERWMEKYLQRVKLMSLDQPLQL